MRIVPHSASASYSCFSKRGQLLLPAPRIAGLLPSGISEPPPEPSPAFTFSDERLDLLPIDQRIQLFDATTTFLEIALGYALGDLNEQALNAALALIRRAVTGERMTPSNPARFAADLDADRLDWLVSAARQQIELHQQIARDVAIRRKSMLLGDEVDS